MPLDTPTPASVKPSPYVFHILLLPGGTSYTAEVTAGWHLSEAYFDDPHLHNTTILRMITRQSARRNFSCGTCATARSYMVPGKTAQVDNLQYALVPNFGTFRKPQRVVRQASSRQEDGRNFEVVYRTVFEVFRSQNRSHPHIS